MVATRKVDQKGRVMVPEQVVREIGGKPGDIVTFRPTGRGTVEMTVAGSERATSVPPRVGAAEASQGPGPSGKQPGVDERREGEVELVPMTLAEMLDRFKIEGPIDEVELREGWHDDAARDVIGE
jgi:bifunctional DNA-binding transcriptional regulator/antitoxin component of YhaV-PrlF toxin-antitoxin module